jgi:hypothetical protein
MRLEFPEGIGPLVPAFADEPRAGGLVLRTPGHADVPAVARVFADPDVGGEAGAPADSTLLARPAADA